MINSVTAISSPYVHSNNGGDKTDYNDNLSAQMWNNLSQAVEAAHSKINGILDDGNITISGVNVNIVSSDEDVQVNGDRNVIIASDGQTNISGGSASISSDNTNVEIAGHGKVLMSAGNDIEMTVDYDSENQYTVYVKDLAAIVKYFKTDTSSGPFAATS